MSMCRDIDGNYCGYLAGNAQLFAELKTREVRACSRTCMGVRMHACMRAHVCAWAVAVARESYRSTGRRGAPRPAVPLPSLHPPPLPCLCPASSSAPQDYLAVLPQAGPQLPAAWLPLIADRMMEAPLSTCVPACLHACVRVVPLVTVEGCMRAA